ncbi:MAG: PAS domain-containing protein [Bacteroidales bacterium]|jgi:transcriptional regulator with PAS, ATPase and Fis domain|nr:PAS domain-containing protein [Bacteroidales bacterium]
MDNIFNELPFMAITVSDKDGKIIDMNNRSAETFKLSGGRSLIGKNLFDCHPERAQQIIRKMMNNPETNTYTIEKGDIHKLIYQTPYYNNGEFAGLIEFSIVIPKNIPNYIRSSK